MCIRDSCHSCSLRFVSARRVPNIPRESAKQTQGAKHIDVTLAPGAGARQPGLSWPLLPHRGAPLGSYEISCTKKPSSGPGLGRLVPRRGQTYRCKYANSTHSYVVHTLRRFRTNVHDATLSKSAVAELHAAGKSRNGARVRRNTRIDHSDTPPKRPPPPRAARRCSSAAAGSQASARPAAAPLAAAPHRSRRRRARSRACLLYTSPSPRDATLSRMPSSA